jgi:DNA-binding IclR family transcriptional regulator
MSDKSEFSKLTWLKGVPGAGLSGGELTVLLVIFNYTGQDGRGAHPGVDLMVKETGLGERTIKRALSSLTRRGLLMQDGRGGRSWSGEKWASTYSLGSLATCQPRHLEGEESENLLSRENASSTLNVPNDVTQRAIRVSLKVPPRPPRQILLYQILKEQIL